MGDQDCGWFGIRRVGAVGGGGGGFVAAYGTGGSLLSYL